MASTTTTPTSMSLQLTSLYSLPREAGLPTSHTATITTTPPAVTPTVSHDTITAESHSQTGNYSTSFLDALSAVADAVTRSLTLPEVAMTSTAGDQDTSGADGADFDFTTTAAVASPTSAADDAPHTDSDEVVGAILQVLLHGAQTAADLTTAQEAADLDVAVTEGGLAAVTSDMQYSVVTNFTNLTIDLLTNATYRGVLTIGGSGGGDGSSGTPPLQLSRYSLHEGILIGIILSLIVFFSIFGNIVVCAAILSDRNLRKTSNYFIVSLAVADMLVASMVMSFAVANDILGYWIFGETFCSVWISLDIMCSTASIINLCAISLDRYVHIRSPLHYETWVTPLRTCIAMSAVWILSALMSFLPIHLGWHQLGLTPKPTSVPPSPSPSSPLPAVSASSPSHKEHFICMMELNPWYAVVSSMVSFYMPCVVMIAIYLKLYAYARRHVDAIKTQTRTPMLQNGASPKGKTSAYYKMADHKAAITLGVIMGTFLFCWTPFFTINIVGAFCPVCIPTVVFQVFTWLGYFNSTLNPIIYSIFNKEFREAFKRVLNFRRCCRRRDDDFRRPIKYTETYGTVSRKSLTKQNDEVTAV